MIYFFFKNIPPKYSVKIFYIFTSILFLYRFLFKSVFGILFIALILYKFSSSIWDIESYNLGQLLEWVHHLEKDYKLALITSGVTIIGFVIAFHTATTNWRNQMFAQLRLNAANEIETFFAEFSKNITDSELYIQSLINALEKIKNGVDVAEANFIVNYSCERIEDFMDSRNKISEASVQVHKLISKNYNLLVNNPGTLDSINRSGIAISDISKKIWIKLPVVKPEGNNKILSFVEQTNINEYIEFVEVCKKSSAIISGLSGGVKGQLQSVIMDFNVHMLFHLLKNRKSFKESIVSLHKELND